MWLRLTILLFTYQIVCSVGFKRGIHQENLSGGNQVKRAALPESNNKGVIRTHKNKNFDIYVLYDYEDSNETNNDNNSGEGVRDEISSKETLPPILWKLQSRGRNSSSSKGRTDSPKSTSLEDLSKIDENFQNSSLVTSLLKGVTDTGQQNENSIPTTSEKKSKKENGACVTKECTLAASDIIRSLDTSVEPCDDFYKFACGGWLKSNPLESPIEAWSQFHVLEEKLRKEIKSILEKSVDKNEPKAVQNAKKFYSSCKEKKPLNDLSTHLQQLTNKYLDGIEDDLEFPHKFARRLGTLRREFGGDYIISLFVGLDDKNSSAHGLYIDSPSLALERIYHVDLGPKNDNYQAQIKSIVEYWPQVYPDTKSSDVQKIAENILAFETKIAEITGRPEDLRNETELYNPYTMGEFTEEFGGTESFISYNDYIEEVFKEVVELDGVDLGDIDDLEVIIREKDFFTKLNHVLHSAIDKNRNVIGNYLRWRVILDYGIVQSRRLQELGFSKLVSIKHNNNLKTSEDRDKFCADLTNSYFGMAITYSSVKEGFTAASYDEVKEMASNIMVGFFDIINESEWIATEETKEKAKLKSRKMRPFIGYPDWLLNDTALDEHYKEAIFSNPDDHFQNYFEMSKWDLRSNLRKVKAPGDATRWVRDPMVVNAFYHSQGNSFYFPAGILQPPLFFTGSQVQALNYGAIGMVMGHEFTHAFDDSGKQRDENGNLNVWWDDVTLENYLKRAQCFSEQYSNYEVKELAAEDRKVFLNGNLTLDENIADNGGLREAFGGYKAYVKKNGPEKKLPGLEYTPEQLFFLAFAQAWCGAASQDEYLADVEVEEHSPYPFRVKGVLDNSPEFSETWGCPPPSEKSCRLW